jgi:hypothetical protein
LYLRSTASPVITSRSYDRLAAVVRGFWKSLSKTNTSGRNGSPIADCGIRPG